MIETCIFARWGIKTMIRRSRPRLTLTIASWNHVVDWLRQVDMLHQAKLSAAAGVFGHGAACAIGLPCLLRLRPRSIPLGEARVARFERLLGATDPEPLYFCPDVEDVAGGGEEGCVLAGLNGAESVGHAVELRRDKGDRGERGLAGEAEGGCLRGGVRQIALVGSVHAGWTRADRHRYASLVQDAGGAELHVVGIGG